MIGGYKVNATEVNQNLLSEQSYHQTEEWRRKNGFGIYVVIVTIVLLFLFGA